jgi:pectate lyase
MLIGNSDQATEDRGHLRVTLHHNLFDDIGQRTPRVRFRAGARVRQFLPHHQQD